VAQILERLKHFGDALVPLCSIFAQRFADNLLKLTRSLPDITRERRWLLTRGRAGDPGYLPIYEIGGKADVNVAQLVLNVSFAALAGALAANLPRRAVYLIAACFSVAAIATGIVAVVRISEASVVRAQQSAVARAYSDERYADQLLRFARFQSPLQQEDVKKAKLYLLHAAENWHTAGNTAEEQRVRAKEKNIIDLPGLPDQSTTPAPAGKTKNPFDQFDAAALGSGAAHPKAYRVTGPVLEVTDTMIAVQKGTDRWEVAHDSNTKVTGDLKVGATVTITYTMTAAEVAVKPYISTDQGMRHSPHPEVDFSDLVPKQPKKQTLNPSDFPDQPQKPR